MKPRPITPADLGYWADYSPEPHIIGGPPSEPDCIPCPAVVTRDRERGDQIIVRVPFELDEIELMHLAKGGTLWLSTWGGLPIHMMEVQEPAAGPGHVEDVPLSASEPTHDPKAGCGT